MLRRLSSRFAKKDEKQAVPAYLTDEEKHSETAIEKSVVKKCEELGLDYSMVREVLRRLLDRGMVDEFYYDSQNENKRSEGMRFISENFSELCKKTNFDTKYKTALVETSGEILVLKAYL